MTVKGPKVSFEGNGDDMKSDCGDGWKFCNLPENHGRFNLGDFMV